MRENNRFRIYARNAKTMLYHIFAVFILGRRAREPSRYETRAKVSTKRGPSLVDPLYGPPKVRLWLCKTSRYDNAVKCEVM